MIPPNLLIQSGAIPIRDRPVRFAVGSPDGLSSNSWKVWASKSGIYIACRDSFNNTKVSLHPSSTPLRPGRWRMGFTSESGLKMNDNRAWEVWDEPPSTLPNTVVAFRLYFLTSELAVRPEMRNPADWKKVIYVESGPPGKMTVFTLFVTLNDPPLSHQSEPSFSLASFAFDRGRRAQLVAHGELENGFPDLIKTKAIQSIDQMRSTGHAIPETAYGYLFGRQEDGCRFIVGARMGPYL